MSASREKKIRQEVSSQENYIDPKAEREAKERADARKSNALYIAVAAVFVVVAVAMILLRSGVFQKKVTALTIDGTEYTPAQVDFFYYNAYSSIRSSGYAGVMGLDESKPLSDQTLNDTAKMLLGITEEGELLWSDYFKTQAKDAIKQVHALYTAAVADGYTADDTVKNEIQANVDAIGTYAKQSGYSAEQYVKFIYGNSMNLKTLRAILEMALIADRYQADHIAALTYSDADLEAHYASDRDCFDMGTYEYMYFNGTAASTKDADGNTVEPTEEEKSAAAQKAIDDAAAVMERLAAGEKLADIANELEGASYYKADGTQTKNSSIVDEWVYDASRKAGDFTTLESESSRYVVVFENVARPEYPVVNVRHILFEADTDALDSTSETYESDKQKIWDDTLAEAEKAYADWQAAAPSAESFAAMASELTDDTGSRENGGLYEGISKSTNFVPSFLDWCFAEGRKVGDSGIIESSYGYHVMYLDSFGDAYWKVMARDELSAADTGEWLDGLTKDLVVTDGEGMKNVG